MNIITDDWMPVTLRSGRSTSISPAGIASRDDPPIRLAFARADWNLAGLELLIGLIYLVAPPADEDDWHELSGSHNVGPLNERLRRLAPWFHLDALEGPRFLQDMERIDGNLLPCDRLCIDAPGENAIKGNTDLLVKRTQGLVFSRSTAAIALYSLQQFAPNGGSGNRTSMRGGGPMVTLVEPTPDATLMEIVWANVPDGEPIDVANSEAVAEALPWTASTRTSGKPNSAVDAPERRAIGPSAQVFFGMPRRINLAFGDTSAECALSGACDERPVIGFRQVKHGTNYGQWLHPNTPYYRVKQGSEPLPVHPKPGRFGYRHYRGTVLRDDRSSLRSRAACVDTYERERDDTRPARLIVGGWAMDNMKALDFVMSLEPVPLSRLTDDAEARAIRAIEAAEIIGGNLSVALKNALGIDPKATDPVSTSRQRFYEETDGAFRELLHALITDPESSVATDVWRKALGKVALRLFDGETKNLIVSVSPERARKILEARRMILAATGGYSKSGKSLFVLLDLTPPRKAGEKLQSTENSSE